MNRSTDWLGGALALGFALLGVIVMVESVRLGLGSFELPGPGQFPFFAGLMLFVGAVIVLVGEAVSGAPALDAMFEPGGIRKLALLIAIFAGWILVMPFTGFVLGTFVCVLAFAKVMGLEGALKPFAVALGTSVGVYILFERLLQLDLPSGPWG